MTDTDASNNWERRIELVELDTASDPRGSKRRLEAVLNSLHREGWELVSMASRSDRGIEQMECVLKRHRTE